MNQEKWELFDKEGWILGPLETDEELESRKLEVDSKKDFIRDGSLKAHQLTQKIYNFQFLKAPIFYSNKQMLPWQGAAFWIYTEEGKSFPVIQMRTNYNRWYFRSYDEQEILAHELVHAARFAFKEPFFEEILAYKTSSSWFHRFFGPICIIPQEATYLIILVLGGCLGFALSGWMYFLWIPFVFFLSLLVRLCVLQAIFFLATLNLEKAGCLGISSLSFLFRLTDREIFTVAITPPSRLREKLLKKNSGRLKRLIERFLF